MKINKHIQSRIEKVGSAPICNLKAERAPSCLGFVFPFCYRCTGVIIGGIIGAFLHFLSLAEANYALFVILALPCGIDGLVQKFKIQKSNNPRRLVTGLMLGIGLAFI